MKRMTFGLLLAGALAVPHGAMAASNTTVGVGTGAVAGAVIAGPVGAVVGGIIGGVVGSNSERARPRRVRRARSVRARAAMAPKVRVAEERNGAARAPEPIRTGSVPRTGEAGPAKASTAPTGWQNPR
ncbi:hypothetical protein G3T14_19800 [Methylobacterium sp. BTF04]|uniref:hypothetical protein n=1 Tax=Methylobacterium sp. BTF04 TaxID=2708300 RepID=UPI0013D5AAD8|nr:hypothetical protein [Methylobacterium sp. BTF04]NEU14353.1 hypothetical protein [Methylobacterium sp. BTF04]